MKDAVAELVRDGDSVAIEGFTHLICFAAGHEIIRQRKRDLTLARLTPDLIYDQMIAAGVARKLVFSWLARTGTQSSNLPSMVIVLIVGPAARDSPSWNRVRTASTRPKRFSNVFMGHS